MTLNSMEALGKLYVDEGQHTRAAGLFTTVLKVRRRVLGENHPYTIEVQTCLGGVRLEQQRYAEAEPQLRAALDIYEKTTPDAWTRYQAESLLGASLAGQQKYEQAEPLLLSGYQGMTQRLATIPVYSRSALPRAEDWIIRLYLDWGKPEKAAEWRGKISR
jgi:tetratricopeptide (TPR) repeat protein